MTTSPFDTVTIVVGGKLGFLQDMPGTKLEEIARGHPALVTPFPGSFVSEYHVVRRYQGVKGTNRSEIPTSVVSK